MSSQMSIEIHKLPLAFFCLALASLLFVHYGRDMMGSGTAEDEGGEGNEKDIGYDRDAKVLEMEDGESA
jgi:hypothetical protein